VLGKEKENITCVKEPRSARAGKREGKRAGLEPAVARAKVGKRGFIAGKKTGRDE